MLGAVIGAVVVNFAKTWLTGSMPDLWLFVLGALFILVTLAFPRGILGLIGKLRFKPAPRPAAPVAGEEGAP